MTNKGQHPLSAVEVARYVRLYEPIATGTLARVMRESTMRVRNGTKLAHDMGFIQRLPNDTRWYVVRIG